MMSGLSSPLPKGEGANDRFSEISWTIVHGGIDLAPTGWLGVARIISPHIQFYRTDHIG